MLLVSGCCVFEYRGDVELRLRVTERDWTRRGGLYVNTIDADGLKDEENREGRWEGKCSFLPSLA